MLSPILTWKKEEENVDDTSHLIFFSYTIIHRKRVTFGFKTRKSLAIYQDCLLTLSRTTSKLKLGICPVLFLILTINRPTTSNLETKGKTFVGRPRKETSLFSQPFTDLNVTILEIA